ncbi:MAG: 16S rRNA (adenine(1518)-N(6)/adenine(1519)-N(6))-dimethyltransferase RsmA [Dethiobacteria bacterium]|jgi:16S rRNA (adenine1518-N6/adenine1519-N6)-dimethyltransferase
MASGEKGRGKREALSPGKVTSPLYLQKILREKNLRPRRSMGQHFLIDGNILEKIVVAAELTKDDLVIDIGAGPGALSFFLSEKAAGVIAVEWDSGLVGLLKEQTRLRRIDNLTVVEGDVRRMDLYKLSREHWGEKFSGGKENRPVKIVANLPYYLVTPLLFQLLQGRLPLKLLVLMVQFEVAERMIAAPGGKDYGLLSILCQYYTKPRLLFKVSRHVFYPPPKVGSAVVSLEPLPTPAENIRNEEAFWQIVRAAFQKRRKTILNALDGVGNCGKGDWEKFLLEKGISPRRRGETLTLREFANLSEMFYN